MSKSRPPKKNHPWKWFPIAPAKSQADRDELELKNETFAKMQRHEAKHGNRYRRKFPGHDYF